MLPRCSVEVPIVVRAAFSSPQRIYFDLSDASRTLREGRGPWPLPRLSAHRGGGKTTRETWTPAPENTLAGARAARAFGFTGIEYDVNRLLAGGALPVFHDDELERTTNGAGRLIDLAESALLELDAGSSNSAAFRGEQVPLFPEMFRYCAANGLAQAVEIKPTAGHERATGIAVAEATSGLYHEARREYPGRDIPLPALLSFSTTALAAAREVAPGLPRVLNVERKRDGDMLNGDRWREVAQRLHALECAGVGPDHTMLNDAAIERIHADGYYVAAWTVNDPRRAGYLLAAGVDTLHTDMVHRFAAAGTVRDGRLTDDEVRPPGARWAGDSFSTRPR
jgi:glycerophosphoryl diester phosphodiesterase